MDNMFTNYVHTFKHILDSINEKYILKHLGEIITKEDFKFLDDKNNVLDPNDREQLDKCVAIITPQYTITNHTYLLLEYIRGIQAFELVKFDLQPCLGINEDELRLMASLSDLFLYGYYDIIHNGNKVESIIFIDSTEDEKIICPKTALFSDIKYIKVITTTQEIVIVNSINIMTFLREISITIRQEDIIKILEKNANKVF